ncbi:MAG TPA: LPS assembly protein LptD [Verrucomicrobiae bacterium]|nr:LPS assembly protein LptD [Verrucomicrobiae bacterium]
MRRLPACVAVAGVARTQTKDSRDSHESVAVNTPARRRPAIAPLVFFIAVFSFAACAEEQVTVEEFGTLNQIDSNAPPGQVEMQGTLITATNGFYVRYGDTMLIADNGTYDRSSRETTADGHVRIEMGDQIWVGEHINYNFRTHQMRSEEFRTGKPPVFAAGQALEGNTTNQTYSARHVFVTTDDVSDPATRVRASRIRIVPGKYVEMWNAVLYVDGVPAFYFPYYKRNLGERANNFNFVPGYRSAYGPYLLNTYTWYWGDDLDGQIHLDYRERRGVGAGPDVNLKLGRWGDFALKYYYTHDDDSGSSISTNVFNNLAPIPENRQRIYFAWQATPYTNFNLKALVNYQTDPLLLHDFFEGDYTGNPQPNTFVEANKYWENWSLDAESTPRLNNFFDQVERLPDVKLTGFRQQVFDTPFYYESESSAGYYRQIFAAANEALFTNLNGTLPDYSAARADTYQQVLLPWKFFNWLNVTPRAGGRLTYYGTEGGPGGTNNETFRKVFNTGVETSFKASRLWTGATNSLLEIDGLRHVIEPSVNYVFVPDPSTPPARLPQFDSELPSLEILPIQFPDYNNIDSIDSQNVIRFGLRNTLQTKRDLPSLGSSGAAGGQLDNLLDWNLMLDWRLKPDASTNALNLGAPGPQKTFDDLYSALTFRPRTWLTLESQLRYDINDGHLNLAFHQLTFTPNDRWSWGLGHWYLRSGFLGNGTGGDNFITSTYYYRLNDNWGLRMEHDFDAEAGRLQQQFYSLYRDFRSWTGALTFRVIDNGTGPEDFTVAFSFSLKAKPRLPLGGDTVSPYHLVGE